MNIEDRIERLERQNRRLKIGVASLFVAVVTAGLVGFASQDSVPDVVRAKAFHVVTDDGRVLARLDDGSKRVKTPMDDPTVREGSSEGHLELFGADNSTIAVLGSDIDGDGMLMVRSPRQNSVVVLSHEPSGGSVSVVSENKMVVAMGQGSDGRAAVNLFDSAGSRRVILTVSDEAAGFAALWPDGKIGATLGTALDSSALLMFSESGQRIAEMSRDKDGRGFLGLFGNKLSMVKLGAGTDGQGSIQLFDQRGEKTVVMASSEQLGGIVAVYDPSGLRKAGFLNTEE